MDGKGRSLYHSMRLPARRPACPPARVHHRHQHCPPHPPRCLAAWGALQVNGSQLKVLSYELGVLLTPALEAAYRAHRWRGFSCTSAQPPLAGAAAATAGGAAAAAAAAAAASGEAAQPTLRFVQWRRGTPQEPAATGAHGAGGAPPALRVPLPIPYSLPPARYGAGERPWTNDGRWDGLDALGFERNNRPHFVWGNLDHEEWAEIVQREHLAMGLK